MSLQGNEAEPLRKKRRLSPSENDVSLENVAQLKNLLHFRQDASHEMRNNIHLFKDFLSNISTTTDQDKRLAQIAILRQYCNSQTAATKDQVCLPDLLSTWSFAAQENNDSVLSAVPAALAQFYRTISGLLEFREFGLALCHSLLARDQIRLFERGFSAPRNKEHLISPCLRLLTEVVSFDAGALSATVLSRRDFLHRKIDNFLTLTQTDHVLDLPHREKPSIRRLTIRLLISYLKFLPDAESKVELLLQGKTLFLCFRHLRSDADDIIVDFISAFEHVVFDDNLQRSAKVRMLNAANLSALGDLYSYLQNGESEDELQAADKVRKAVHTVLLKICTSKGGVLRNQSGWYPLGYDAMKSIDKEADVIDLGLDSLGQTDEYHENVPVVNEVLSNFLQTLKPEGDTLQSSLVLKILGAAPELIANYFSRKPSMPSPKDDAHWRQHFAFLFSVIQLPVPTDFGWRGPLPEIPPPISVVVENVLPRPFDPAITSRLFRMKDDVMKLTGARLMSVALEKLHKVTALFASGKTDGSAWSLASERLSEVFLQRSPSHADIVNAIKDGGLEDENVRSALLECLAAYYSTLPTFGGRGSFDVSSTLAKTLQGISDDGVEGGESSTAYDRLSSLLVIADSSTTKWWQAVENTTLSPVSLMLKVVANNKTFTGRKHAMHILRKLIRKSKILLDGDIALDALLKSLTKTKRWSVSEKTLLFLDNCMKRTMQQPIKYLDQVESMQQVVSDKKEVSLLACCVAEQWPFILKEGDTEAIENVARWIARLYACLDAAGENYRVLLQLQQEMIKEAGRRNRLLLEKAIEKQRKEQISLDAQTEDNDIALPAEAAANAHQNNKRLDLPDVLDTPEPFNTSLKGLERLDKMPIEPLIQTGTFSRLIGCFSSPDEETRRLTYHYLQLLLYTIETSDYPESQQLYLLLGELLETIKLTIPTFETPIPSLVISVTNLLLKILSDPSDKMYSKANHFLNRGPSWSISHLLSYWVDKILLNEPEDDDGLHLEQTRFLDLLVCGLRTADDMELYRKSKVFERLLSFYLSAQGTRQVRRKVLGVVYQAVLAGGAETLVTRVGIKSWLGVVRVHDRDVCNALSKLIDERSDRDILRKWEDSRPVLRSARQEEIK